MADVLLHLDTISKTYNQGEVSEITVLRDVNLTFRKGEFVAIMGPSGSGKSTLLNLIGLLDRPSTGRLFIHGQDTNTLDDRALTRLRGHSIGFVFQYHYLIAAFTALENVMMPMLADQGFPNEAIKARAEFLLAQVGLEKVQNNLATNMSGGQQQRVSLARALAMNPPLLLADEPTGNLDTQSADAVFRLMREINRDNGTCFIIVTHNHDLAALCDRTITVVDGRIRTDEKMLQQGGDNALVQSGQ